MYTRREWECTQSFLFHVCGKLQAHHALCRKSSQTTLLQAKNSRWATSKKSSQVHSGQRGVSGVEVTKIVGNRQLRKRIHVYIATGLGGVGGDNTGCTKRLHRDSFCFVPCMPGLVGSSILKIMQLKMMMFFRYCVCVNDFQDENDILVLSWFQMTDLLC